VARDIAHAKLKELLDNGEELPQYVKDHPIYYAGPAKTPEGYASGSSAQPPRAHGLVRGLTAVPRREHDHAGERQPQPAGDRRLP
jgi:fumarate hydratase class I